MAHWMNSNRTSSACQPATLLYRFTTCQPARWAYQAMADTLTNNNKKCCHYNCTHACTSSNQVGSASSKAVTVQSGSPPPRQQQPHLTVGGRQQGGVLDLAFQPAQDPCWIIFPGRPAACCGGGKPLLYRSCHIPWQCVHLRTAWKALTGQLQWVSSDACDMFLCVANICTAKHMQTMYDTALCVMASNAISAEGTE